MTTDVTLGELLSTPLGKQLTEQVDEARAEQRAEADERRQAVLAEAMDSLAATVPAYTALRDETLPMLEVLSLHVGRLLELRNRLRELASLVRKYGGEVPADFPVTLMGTPEFKRAVAQAREVASLAGGAL